MSFEEVLNSEPKELHQLATDVRTLILKTDKRIEEHIYGTKIKTILYSIGGTNNVLYGIGFGKDHVKLYLHHTDAADVAGLKLQGKGKHAKTVWITEMSSTIKKQISSALKNILEVSGY